MQDIADFQTAAAARGYTHNYAIDRESVSRDTLKGLRIVESRSFDTGTDPGDDATIYLIDSSGGPNGYLIVPGSFHTDPAKAAFIDAVLAAQRGEG